MSREVILIDLMNLVYRLFYRSELRASTGEATGVIHGVLTVVLMLAKQYPKASIVICIDSRKSWRKTVNPEYKAKRNKDAVDRSELYQQVGRLKEFFKIIGLRALEIDTLEADDIIGILSQQMKVDTVYIYSNDKDFYQLVNDEGRVFVVRPMPKGVQVIKEKHVEEEFGVKPNKVPLVRALAGDSSDNIKAIKGIAIKTAIKMVQDGVNPSHKAFKNHPYSVCRKYKDKLEKDWDRVHLAWKVTALPRSYLDKCIPTDLVGLVQMKLDKVCSSKGRRKKVDKEQASYDLVQACSELELNEILAKRHLFFNIR